jgi:hypothetical protein
MKTFNGPFARFSSKEFLTFHNLTNVVINSPGFFETTYTTDNKGVFTAIWRRSLARCWSSAMVPPVFGQPSLPGRPVQTFWSSASPLPG